MSELRQVREELFRILDIDQMKNQLQNPENTKAYLEFLKERLRIAKDKLKDLASQKGIGILTFSEEVNSYPKENVLLEGHYQVVKTEEYDENKYAVAFKDNLKIEEEIDGEKVVWDCKVLEDGKIQKKSNDGEEVIENTKENIKRIESAINQQLNEINSKLEDLKLINEVITCLTSKNLKFGNAMNKTAFYDMKESDFIFRIDGIDTLKDDRVGIGVYRGYLYKDDNGNVIDVDFTDMIGDIFAKLDENGNVKDMFLARYYAKDDGMPRVNLIKLDNGDISNAISKMYKEANEKLHKATFIKNMIKLYGIIPNEENIRKLEEIADELSSNEDDRVKINVSKRLSNDNDLDNR